MLLHMRMFIRCLLHLSLSRCTPASLTRIALTTLLRSVARYQTTQIRQLTRIGMTIDALTEADMRERHKHKEKGSCEVAVDAKEKRFYMRKIGLCLSLSPFSTTSGCQHDFLTQCLMRFHCSSIESIRAFEYTSRHLLQLTRQ